MICLDCPLREQTILWFHWSLCDNFRNGSKRYSIVLNVFVAQSEVWSLSRSHTNRLWSCEKKCKTRIRCHCLLRVVYGGMFVIVSPNAVCDVVLTETTCVQTESKDEDFFSWWEWNWDHLLISNLLGWSILGMRWLRQWVKDGEEKGIPSTRERLTERLVLFITTADVLDFIRQVISPCKRFLASRQWRGKKNGKRESRKRKVIKCLSLSFLFCRECFVLHCSSLLRCCSFVLSLTYYAV